MPDSTFPETRTEFLTYIMSSNVQDSQPDDEQLIRYLLGTMTDEEQIQIERRYFTDDEVFDLLLTVEAELKQRKSGVAVRTAIPAKA